MPEVEKMEKRKLGKSNLEVSAVGLRSGKRFDSGR
jgi:hypothetical protein